ncbi:MAG TPA: TonB-dependent receptor [Longimicrobiales bacterium]|nr:TonB-dependent receptor [Longimicrobiales bacterium]
MSWSVSRFSLFVMLAVVLFGAPASAQAPTGRIIGVVRDADGAPLPAARVTASNRATGVSRSTVAASDGRYALTDVPVGTYTVTASLFGFRESARANVQVSSGATVSLDLRLETIQLETLVVTAMLREQELIDVPFSIAAPTAEVLRSRGVDDIEGVAANVAGFSVQNLGPGQSTVAIRGASGGQIARDQPGVKEQVGAYLDDAPISLSLFTPDLDLFDVSRIEVLRGPQGTLFGAGSLSGTVRYISNQPVLGATSVFGEVGGSFIDGGGPGGNVKVGVNAPLGRSAAARIVAYYTMYGGYIDSQQPVLEADTLVDYRLEDDVNSGQRMGARAALRFEPVANLSITPRVLFQRVDMDGWNRIDAFNILANQFTTTNPAITLGEREQHTQIEEPFTDDFLLTDLNVGYDFGAVDFTSVTSLTLRDILVVRDAGALTGSITGGAPLPLPEAIYRLDAPLDDSTQTRVVTQEFRLSGGLDFALFGLPTVDDRLQWVAGAFYSDSKREYSQTLLVEGFDEAAAPILGAPVGFTEGLRAARDVLFFSDLEYDLSQFALFGEATVPVGSRVDLTGGLRWYSFSEDREQVFDGIFAHDNTGTEVVSQPGSIDSDGLAPRFIASFEATDWLNLNAQAAKGFRLGGINDPLNVPLCTPEDLALFSGQNTWEDETVWNYEIGAKSSLFGGRGSLNVSAFNMDISDYQVVITAGTCSSRLVLNAPEATSRGIEVELTAAPAEFFDFSVSGTFTDSELGARPVSVTGEEIVIDGIEEGNRLPGVPEFEAAAAATFRFGLAQMPAFLTGSFHHVGSRYTQINDHAEGVGTVDITALDASGEPIGGPLTATTFTFDPEMPAYSILNLRAGVSLGGNWEVALFVNNLTDETVFLALDRERGTLARVGYLTNQPRTIGISFRFGD